MSAPVVPDELAEQMRRRNEDFREIWEQLILMDTDFGPLFDFLGDILGWNNDLESIEQEVLGNIFYDEIVNGRLDFNGQPDRIEQSMNIALDNAIERGEITFSSPEDSAEFRAAFHDIAADLVERSGPIDPGYLRDRLTALSDEIGVGYANFGNIDHENLDYSKAMDARMVALDDNVDPDGRPIQITSPEGEAYFSFAEGNIDVFRMDAADNGAPIFTQVGEFTQADLRDLFSDGDFEIRTVYHEDSDLDARHAMGYHMSGTDAQGNEFSFYVGPDAIPDRIEDTINVQPAFTGQRQELDPFDVAEAPESKYSNELIAELAGQTSPVTGNPMSQQEILEQIRRIQEANLASNPYAQQAANSPGLDAFLR